MFWRLFYNIIVIPLEWILFQILALFNRKAARGKRGRARLFEQLQDDLNRLKPASKRIWFHSSSMGEFEQAKPIIAELKKRHPELQIIVSFFSPSGYEHSQSYRLASVVTYLPFDSYRSAQRFVTMIRPTVAIIVRYDVWPNHLWVLREGGVPIFIANATLRSNTARRYPFLKQFHRALYNGLDYILTVSEEDKRAFESFHFTHPVLEVIGDTRYDQVSQRSKESKLRRVLDGRILSQRKVLVVGSSWKEDEEHLLPACYTLCRDHPEFLIILVPHEPTVENLERIENEINGHLSAIRFSNLSQYANEQLIIIDSVGILMQLYQYASVAYVGGSFRSGVHNVLEPAAYGIPVLFGPRHENSQEAVQLVKDEAAFVGRNEKDFEQHLRSFLDDEARRLEAGKRAAALVCRNTGATERFLSYLGKVL